VTLRQKEERDKDIDCAGERGQFGEGNIHDGEELRMLNIIHMSV
jgi:hypothetical protein